MKLGYDEILKLDNENAGLALDIYGHNLRNSYPVNRYSVPDYTFNDDIVCVRCADCDEWMMYIHGFTGRLDGIWRCSKCGKKITEMRIYKKIESENESWQRRYED